MTYGEKNHFPFPSILILPPYKNSFLYPLNDLNLSLSHTKSLPDENLYEINDNKNSGEKTFALTISYTYTEYWYV